MANEGTLQKYLFHQASANKIYCRKMASPGRRGFPDVMLAAKGQTIFIELKHPGGGGKLSALQRNEIKRMLACGLDVRVIWKKENIDAAIRELT